MKISLNWLKEFVDVAADPKGLQLELKALGLGAETISSFHDDSILDLEITTNRPDCLSHSGVAREVATLHRTPLKLLQISLKESGAPATGEVSIEITAPDLCSRYCGRVIQNVQVKPSPDWLARRLEAVGQRPINNVADITNYVLMELGHPLHAFDLAFLRDKKIIVRRARPGEHLKTLDGVDRTLTADHLVIADGRLPVALAGIMGGEESEISAATRDILLESAWFEPASIRRTSKSFGMHTEASHRFERGADIESAPVALDRAAELIAELAGGTVLSGVVDVYPRPFAGREIVYRRSEIRRILGTDIPGKDAEYILRALGFKVQSQEGGWRVAPPSWRLDVTREVDLTEEIARVTGYDRLPQRVRPAPPSVEGDTRREKELVVAEILVASGYRQIIANSMVDPAENARFTDLPPVVLQNPLSQEASAMRSTPVPGMLRALRWNLDRGQADLRLFELGKTYSAHRNPATHLPAEERVLTLGLTGRRRPQSVHDEAKSANFFDLKGDLENLLSAFEIRELKFEPASIAYGKPDEWGRFVDQGGTLADFGEISAAIARDYKLPESLWIAVINIERLLACPRRVLHFTPFSRFPAVERDFSIVVPDTVRYQQIDQVLQALTVEEIRRFRAADRADRSKVPTLPPGHYSLLLRVTFQSRTHTLTSGEIDTLGRQVLAALEALGIRLRI
ncbi:MAG TPA: phenylalanine--tRNA ligase subunit beta [Terriglobia bacterium]|nr:phenylalanine--tRNA ligase subunit beta [Terriglobia bacterium]